MSDRMSTHTRQQDNVLYYLVASLFRALKSKLNHTFRNNNATSIESNLK